jgi:hypothetical protein
MGAAEQGDGSQQKQSQNEKAKRYRDHKRLANLFIERSQTLGAIDGFMSPVTRAGTGKRCR